MGEKENKEMDKLRRGILEEWEREIYWDRNKYKEENKKEYICIRINMYRVYECVFCVSSSEQFSEYGSVAVP